jgi:long-chain acyl-CoA synthetase
VFQSADLASISGSDLTLRGRLSESINVAGRKVAPSQVEDALLACPGVRHCVVFGVPSADPSRVEEIVAAVNPGPGCSLSDIKTLAAASLPFWLVPRRWWLRGDLAPDQRGKTPRAAWRTRFLAQSDRE